MGINKRLFTSYQDGYDDGFESEINKGCIGVGFVRNTNNPPTFEDLENNAYSEGFFDGIKDNIDGNPKSHEVRVVSGGIVKKEMSI